MFVTIFAQPKLGNSLPENPLVEYPMETLAMQATILPEIPAKARDSVIARVTYLSNSTVHVYSTYIMVCTAGLRIDKTKHSDTRKPKFQSYLLTATSEER